MRDQIRPALRDQNETAKCPVWFRIWARLGARSGVRFGIDFHFEFVALTRPSVQAFAGWLLASGCRLLPAACWPLAAGRWLLAAGFQGSWVPRFLAAGSCLLLAAAGCGLLAAGCSLLAAGCWLLAEVRTAKPPATTHETVCVSVLLVRHDECWCDQGAEKSHGPIFGPCVLVEKGDCSVR